MTSLILILFVFGLAILGIAVRLIFVKNGEVRGGCAGKNPLLNQEGVSCSMCGAKPGDACLEESKAN